LLYLITEAQATSKHEAYQVTALSEQRTYIKTSTELQRDVKSGIYK
jgi:hypothetical protein